MSLLEIGALLRRHKIAVILVLLLALAIAIDVKKTPQVYQESATVVFTVPVSAANPNPYFSFNEDLIPTGSVIISILMSPASQQRVRKAGGSAQFNVVLVNLYNLEYPYHGVPYATLTTTSESLAAVHRTFVVVAQQLDSILASRQASVTPHNRITAKIIGDSGPIVASGSRKRTYAGLVLLTVVVAFTLANSLDRRRRRLGGEKPF
jgi:hypothetical protein